MPRTPNKDKPFDQNKYIQDWSKQNMSYVGAKYKKDFVQEFKEACTKLGTSQSKVFKQAMQEIINEAKET